MIADFKSKWQLARFNRFDAIIKTTLRTIPHFLKQYGIVKILTPIILFPKFIVCLNVDMMIRDGFVDDSSL